ncbi:MFS transporter [Sabulicella glaciei]|uniref:MFS transporter n=1 Tax=Sabulicella glaciei TaxID=2984948 RepID=A0ABT3NWD0_9PROT|nr:MFS transporter [Roseococcus sp. MDT2-1-1]MCW8086474.1 MFS transporter [Roseococcus sp. MDT2-1-1]
MRTVILLGTAQTFAWAGSYYVPALLAAPMARELGIAPSRVFLAFSVALLLTAFLGPSVGRAIDRHGGRGVLSFGNACLALGLALMAMAQGEAMLFVAWAVMGIGMAAGLYDAAFATLARLLGKEARGAITGITLIAGFASTLGWPLSAAMEGAFGWRGALWGWAAIQLFLCIPLNLLLPRPPAVLEPAAAPAAPLADARRAGLRAAILVSVAIAVGGFGASALGAHLPGLLMAGGATQGAAIAAAALLGPAQVGARLLEFGLLRRLHPLLSARMAMLMHPAGAAALMAVGAPAAPVFAVLHGGGNGIMTIARGTLPLALFGAAGYGARQGLIVAPARFLGALAPALFGFAVEGWGAQALWLTAGLSVIGFAALMLLSVNREEN